MNYISKIKESLSCGKRYIIVCEETKDNEGSKILKGLLNDEDVLVKYDTRLISNTGKDSFNDTKYVRNTMIEEFFGRYDPFDSKIVLIENYELLDDATKSTILNKFKDKEKDTLFVIHTNDLNIYSKFMIKANNNKKNTANYKCFLVK